MLFARSGFEKNLYGRTLTLFPKAAARSALWARDTMPAGCGFDWFGLPGVNASPAVPVESLFVMVFSTMLILAVSCIEMAPPASAATLLTMMLLSTSTLYQLLGWLP